MLFRQWLKRNRIMTEFFGSWSGEEPADGVVETVETVETVTTTRTTTRRSAPSVSPTLIVTPHELARPLI